MRAEKGDVFLQELGAAHAGIVVETRFGLSLGHASTTGQKATPLDNHPVHLFRCSKRGLSAAAATQAAKWCTRLIQVPGAGGPGEYIPFADRQREQKIGQLESQRMGTYGAAKAEKLDELMAQPSASGFLSSLFRSPGPRQITEADLSKVEMAGVAALSKRQDQEFKDYGRFRAIKYAARRELSVAHIEYDNSREKGYTLGPSTTCAMFTVLCYQVAGLAPFVDACATFGADDWVSNKHGAILAYDLNDHVSMANLNIYKQYLVRDYGADHVVEEYGDQQVNVTVPVSARTQKRYRSPLSAWTGGSIDSFDFAGTLTKAMCIDAKRCRAPELFARCAMDKESWEYLGFFKFKEGTPELTPESLEGVPARTDPRNY